MRRTLARWSLTLVCALSAGCNSIYFYETEKLSITAEGRPDSSSPISFNLGLKQRVAAIVPPKQMGGKNPESDAVSLISYFDFKKKKAKGGFWLNDSVTIKTALITGEVAADLGDEKTGKAMSAFTQTARFPTPEVEQMQGLFDRINEREETMRDALYESAVRILHKNKFGSMYDKAKTQFNLTPLQAFVAAKNEYLEEESGEGPKHDDVIEALRTVLE